MGTDKVYHFIAGFLIYSVLEAVAVYFNVNLSSLIIMMIVLFVGVSKEVFDKYTNRDVEIADVVATVLGGFVGLYLTF